MDHWLSKGAFRVYVEVGSREIGGNQVAITNAKTHIIALLHKVRLHPSGMSLKPG